MLVYMTCFPNLSNFFNITCFPKVLRCFYTSLVFLTFSIVVGKSMNALGSTTYVVHTPVGL